MAAKAMKPRPAVMSRQGGVLGDRDIGAGNPGQQTTQQHGAIAQPCDRDAGRVDGLRVFADGAQAQAEACAVDQPMRRRHGEQTDIDDHVMAAQHVFVDRSEHGQGVGAVGPGQDDGRETGVGRQQRRLSALLEPCGPQDDGEARGEDIDGHTAHHLIALVGDAGEAMQQGHGRRRQYAGAEREPGRAGDGRDRGGGKGGGQHLAFEPDVDDARPFGEQAGHCAEDQRCRQPERGAEGQEKEGRIRHVRPAVP
jgi:hypothetical protein